MTAITENSPMTVLVGPLTYKVVWFDEQDIHVHDHLGWADSTGQRLSLCKDFSPDRAAEVFLHEVLHALFDQARIFKREPNEELVCNILGYALTRFWMDNPKAHEWWTALLSAKEATP